MATSDLGKPTSFSKVKIVLPTEVPDETAVDSYSQSSSDESELMADAPLYPGGVRRTFGASPNAPVSGRRPVKSKSESEWRDDYTGNHFRRFSGRKVDGKSIFDPHLSWSRLQLAQAQQMANTNGKNQATNSSSKFDENYGQRRAEKHSLIDTLDMRGSQPFDIPKPPFPSYSKLKKINGDEPALNRTDQSGLLMARQTDLGAAVLTSDRFSWNTDGLSNEFPLRQRSKVSTMPFTAAKRVTMPPVDDRHGRIAHLERRMREHLGGSVTHSQSLSSSLTIPKSPNSNATSQSKSNGNGIVVEQLFEESRDGNDTVQASSATQLARPTVRRPCLASLPSSFASVGSLLNASLSQRTNENASSRASQRTYYSNNGGVQPDPNVLLVDADFLSSEPINGVRSDSHLAGAFGDVASFLGARQQLQARQQPSHSSLSVLNNAMSLSQRVDPFLVSTDSGAQFPADGAGLVSNVVSDAINNLHQNLRLHQLASNNAADSATRQNQTSDANQSSGYQSASTSNSTVHSSASKLNSKPNGNGNASKLNLTEYLFRGANEITPTVSRIVSKPALPSLSRRNGVRDGSMAPSSNRHDSNELNSVVEPEFDVDDETVEDEMSDVGCDQEDTEAGELDDRFVSGPPKNLTYRRGSESKTGTRRSGRGGSVSRRKSFDEASNLTSSESEQVQIDVYVYGKPSALTFLAAKPISNPADAPQPALFYSRFAFMPVVIHFVPEGEQVERLSLEIRKVLKWRVSTITPIVVKKCVARSGFRITKKAHEWLGCFGRHMRTEGFKAIRRYQKFNHFPCSFQIGRKDRLWRNVHRMQNLFGRAHTEFGFVPETFILPDDYESARAKWEEQEQASIKPIFIMKPPAAARGRGIKVVRRWSDVPKKRSLVVQNYLRDPFLINGHKFDLRIYVYVSSVDPLRIYIYRDGLVRFASARFSLHDKSLKNRFAHLTNYSINSQNKDYRPNKDGNNNSEGNQAEESSTERQSHKWSLKAFWSYLRQANVRCDSLWTDIKQIVVKTILSAESAVNSAVKSNVKRRYCVHELFGFDIIVDSSLKPWLLECNISPSLHSDSPLDVRVKSHLVADIFNIAGFQIPDVRSIRPLRSKYALRYQVDGGDPEDYQATLVCLPQPPADIATSTGENASVQPSTARASTTLNPSTSRIATGANPNAGIGAEPAGNKDLDSDDSDSSSSSSDTELDEDDVEQPYYVTDRRVATRKLTANERAKHSFYCQNYQNEKMMETILSRLTPDDIYTLCEMVDEFSRTGDFDIVFPTTDSNVYFRFFEQPRYYNLLAFYFLKKFNTESKLSKAITQLDALCRKRIHLSSNLSPNSEHYWVMPNGRNN